MSPSAELCVLAFVFLSKGDIALGQTGLNAIVLVKDSAMLDCNVSSMESTVWIRTTDGESDTLPIASGCSVSGNNAAYYSTEQPGGSICRLTIRNATMQQAGVYACFDGSSTSYRSLVTVIDPVASVFVYNQTEVVEGDQLNISCSINYTGPSSPAPSLRPSPYWTTSTEQNFTSAIYYTSPNSVTSVATITVQKTIVPIFYCNTVFEITGSPSGYNLIAPADNLTVGATFELDVKYAPFKPSLNSRPTPDVITYGGVPCGASVLTCNSTGNPAPAYRWYDSAELNVILSTSNTLTLGEINRNYICEAYNTIRNVPNNAAATYTVSRDDCTSTVECCVFPHNETTSVTVESCDNVALCNCSYGSSGIKLICNATTFPNSSYRWSGPNEQHTDAPVYDKINMNGIYRCTAYFNRTLSNYTGDVMFPTGTNETNVDICGDEQTPTTSMTVESTKHTAAISASEFTLGNICDTVIAAAIAVGVILFISQTGISEEKSKR